MTRTALWLALTLLILLFARRRLRRRGADTAPGEQPGWRYAVERLRGIIAPPVKITPPPSGVRFERDLAVAVRDGTILRVNVFRPPDDGLYPAILSAHPYGKDNLPRRGPFGYQIPMQYRLFRHPWPISHSAWTGWEAPDPTYWVPRGYAVVNCDLRGFGTSAGYANLLTDAEAHDIYDLIEWAAAQPWCNGKVGMSGVSYLAISQYKVAGLHPPHLAAICPWEGFSDPYRDLARPGGIREDGFFRVWASAIKRSGRSHDDLRRAQLDHPLRDEWWASRTPDPARIEVPLLVCGSFSDQLLHSGGSFRVFERVASPRRWLYTHRSGKWNSYYSAEALDFQRRFFDHFLQGQENGMLDSPPVRLEVREDRDTIHAARHEPAWPLPQTHWTDLHLRADGRLVDAPISGPGAVTFDMRSGRASFLWDVPDDTEISGPMALRLFLELQGAEDVCLFVGAQKLRNGRAVPLEGSYGYGFDRVATGFLRASLRKLDHERSTPWQPVHTCGDEELLKPGEVVATDIALLPSATFFRKGEQLRLDVQGRWFSSPNPLYGQFPAAYERSSRGTCMLHCGGEYAARLRIPVIGAPS